MVGMKRFLEALLVIDSLLVSDILDAVETSADEGIFEAIQSEDINIIELTAAENCASALARSKEHTYLTFCHIWRMHP
jgi:hypothetical protein